MPQLSHPNYELAQPPQGRGGEMKTLKQLQRIKRTLKSETVTEKQVDECIDSLIEIVKTRIDVINLEKSVEKLIWRLNSKL
jgi:hypothetical protein